MQLEYTVRTKEWNLNEMELPNQDKIRTLGEKETYKYLDILETDTTNKWRWKKKLRKNTWCIQ